MSRSNAKGPQSDSLDPLRMPLVVLTVGALSILLLLAVDRLRQRSTIEDTALILALGEVELGVAISHLWLEEHVSGDQVEVAQISLSLKRATSLLGAMLGENPAPADMPDLRPMEETSLLQLGNNLNFYLDTFSRISEQRQQGFKEGRDVGIGSPEDIEYDRVFDALLATGQLMEQALEQKRQANRQRAEGRTSAILLAWGALIIAIAYGLWRRELRRQQTENDLSASREQFMQSQKLEAVGRLADGIAHDINNYLASVRAGSELVRMKRAEDEWLVRKMDTVVDTVTKAASLIERLLAFSRKRPAKAQVLSLNRAVEGLEKMMRRLIGADIRLETRLPGNLWLCEMDLAQLEQVIVNLLVNARDAMPTGGRLRLETANEPAADHPLAGPLAEQDRVLLRVSDTGVGIPLAIRDKIFEPFFTTKESVGGSGLGLSTVYGVVRQSGGEISVASREQGGTTFEIRLPRSLQAETPIEGLESGEGHGGDIGSEHILLVDDNESFRQSTAALLQAFGYEVTSAASGDEALAAIEARSVPFDVVLTDVVMPGMGGRQLFDLLGGENTPLIFMSGYTDSVLERHGIGVDKAAILKKPFSANEMTLLLRRVLGQSSPAQNP